MVRCKNLEGSPDRLYQALIASAAWQRVSGDLSRPWSHAFAIVVERRLRGCRQAHRREGTITIIRGLGTNSRFRGLELVECGDKISAAFGTRRFADLDAEIVKIEAQDRTSLRRRDPRARAFVEDEPDPVRGVYG
jgi:hypothetical protein